MRWARHVARVGSRRALVGGRAGNKHLEDLSVDGRVTLKWTVKKWDGEAWTGLNWLRIGTGGGHL
jgi:hypothetical protein